MTTHSAARIYHVAEILLNEIGFRRCVIRFDDFFTDNGFNRADEAGFKSEFSRMERTI